ncbi:hypothetical protein GUITHDRAFT_77525 [Guillardia theta CCMP2712]|uniref:Uncharacterized protein n=1 Tax=Guillardia theta (strain CCMP2712) TaxID=905079 RepID=L1IPJ3_GUITC|nr:hypothetical protein GUITHDRAFT_77525 [Guillardia theta CCMP2712]EKX38002.1 hypothetical protein GUITHDRAFT_77525 [Guillardia theta CCMP2712]|eukprot:XP_005824982.1 hypothetical protein GUITHDRAFT_77525 [Guillardia theta CCMP2712]
MDGDWRQVAFWIRRGADVHARDLKLGSNWTSLHHAAFSGFSVTSRTLVELGADLYAREPSFLDTPLHFAAAQGHTKCVKTLVGLGCPVDITNGDGRTPLHEAAGRGQTDTCAALIELGADVNVNHQYLLNQMLWNASACGNESETLRLIRDGADVNSVDSEFLQTTALHRASLHGHGNIVDILLDHGANINFATIWRSTPLHYAVVRGHKDVVETLVVRGCHRASGCVF